MDDRRFMWRLYLKIKFSKALFIKMTLRTELVSGFIFSSSVVGGTTLLFSVHPSCRCHLFKSWMKDEFVCFFSFLLVEELFPLLLLWYWKCSSFTVCVSLFIAIVINNVKWMRPFYISYNCTLFWFDTYIVLHLKTRWIHLDCEHNFGSFSSSRDEASNLMMLWPMLM